MESDSETMTVKVSDTAAAVAEPKAKRKQTEKQKEATKRMLSALAAKRKAAAEDYERDLAAASEYEKQEKMKEKYEKSKAVKKSRQLPPVPSYVTTAQLELMERRLMAALPKEVYREIPLKTEIVEKIVPVDVIHTVHKETIREKPTVVEKKLTGNQLLDSIFFK